MVSSGIVTYSDISLSLSQEHRVLFVDLVEIIYSAVLSTLTSTTTSTTSGYSALPSVAPADAADPAGSGEVGRSRLASAAASAASAAAATSAAAASASAGCDAEMHLFSPSSCRAAARTPQSPLVPQPGPILACARLTAPACARPPSTWDELVEVGGPGGALSWLIAGELPETVTSRGLERPANNRERETVWKAFERFIFSDPVIGLKGVP